MYRAQVCRKTVPGLDHHCSWLNTCVGTRNYTAFFALTCCCAAAFVTEVAVFAALLTSWRPDDAGGGFTALVVVLLLPAVGLAGAFTCLLAFHVHLLALGVGTFEWMLNRREAKRAKARAARSDSVKEREAAAARTREAAKEKGQKQARTAWAKEHPGLAAKQAGERAAAAAAGPDAGARAAGVVDAAAEGDGDGGGGGGDRRVHPGASPASPPVSPARAMITEV